MNYSILQQKVFIVAAGWSSGVVPTLVVEWYKSRLAALKILISNPWLGAQEFSKFTPSADACSLLITCDIELDGALCSVFYAEGSKRSWAFLNAFYFVPVLRHVLS